MARELKLEFQSRLALWLAKSSETRNLWSVAWSFFCVIAKYEDQDIELRETRCRESARSMSLENRASVSEMILDSGEELELER
jgi:hypothetical protein